MNLNEVFSADTCGTEVSLGVGMYFTDEGRIPVLRAVQEAGKARLAAVTPHGYLSTEGIAAYDQAVQKLLFGADSPLTTEGCVITAQALGGTGMLEVGVDSLRRLYSNAKVVISDPSWENHRVLSKSAGFEVVSYAYYGASSHGLNLVGMTDSLNSYASNTTVTLHVHCHNLTGVDMTTEQWKQVMEVIKVRNLIPLLGMAYQGFADGIQRDGLAVHLSAKPGLPLFVSSSFSKSFSLHGERVSAPPIVTISKGEATHVLLQVKRVIHTNYSNPPTHDDTIIANVLTSPELRVMWKRELDRTRDRIKSMCNVLVDKLVAKGMRTDFSFVKAQRGMFSYSGLTSVQVDRLRTGHDICAMSTGRICIAMPNTHNIDAMVNAIADVL